MEVVDEFEYGGSGVFDAHSDVVHCAVDSQGEFPVFVDFVVKDSVVPVVGRGGRGGFGSSVVDGRWGRSVNRPGFDAATV